MSDVETLTGALLEVTPPTVNPLAVPPPSVQGSSWVSFSYSPSPPAAHSAAPRRQAPECLSLGRTVLEACSSEATGRVVVEGGFVSGPWNRAHGVPVNILPAPSGDIYLNFMAVPLLDEGASAAILPLQPGMEAYYRRQGLLPEGASLIEAPLRELDFEHLGYPYTNPLALLSGAKGSGGNRLQDERATVVATFPGEDLRECTAALAHECCQNFDPARANNKADFREQAGKNGYRMLPGQILATERDLDKCMALFGTEKRVWLKLAHGSGGDLVLAIESPGSRDSYMAGLTSLRESVIRGLSHTKYGASAISEYWPEGDLLPRLSSVIVERDAAAVGRLVLNGSKNLLISDSGQRDIGYFVQNTAPEDGSYRGSYSTSLDKALSDAIDAEIAKALPYFRDELNVRGYIGFDFFVIENANQELVVYLVECNARDTISSRSSMLATKLPHFPFYMNINLTADGDLLGYDDVARALTLDGAPLSESGHALGVQVVPFALRTLYSSEGELLLASNQMKVWIGGESLEQVNSVLVRLARENGIKLQ
jgi:hypothetical protein